MQVQGKVSSQLHKHVVVCKLPLDSGGARERMSSLSGSFWRWGEQTSPMPLAGSYFSSQSQQIHGFWPHITSLEDDNWSLAVSVLTYIIIKCKYSSQYHGEDYCKIFRDDYSQSWENMPFNTFSAWDWLTDAKPHTQL